MQKIKQFNTTSKQVLLTDEQSLVSFCNDFSHLFHSSPCAAISPHHENDIIEVIKFCSEQHLPITIRGDGLSQGGQSIPVDGGVALCMKHMNKVGLLQDNLIWVDVGCSWADIIEKTMTKGLVPYALPYNCNLSVGGVLSAGGMGAGAFKHGAIINHVEALRVVDGMGGAHQVNRDDELFQACLGGQGRFGVITQAAIKLRPVHSNIRTFFLAYHDMSQFLSDVKIATQLADYMEVFCSSSMHGSVLNGLKREPLVEWMYGIHVSIEYDEVISENSIDSLMPSKILHVQDESALSYFKRHDGRFELMKASGQWSLLHPWYECYIDRQVVSEVLPDILKRIPAHLAPMVHVLPVKRSDTGFMMFPEVDEVFSIMILNPGIQHNMKDVALETINMLDNILLPLGGKRYQSGYLGENISKEYWQRHFGAKYSKWVALKEKYDPKQVFKSLMYPD